MTLLSAGSVRVNVSASNMTRLTTQGPAHTHFNFQIHGASSGRGGLLSVLP